MYKRRRRRTSRRSNIYRRKRLRLKLLSSRGWMGNSNRKRARALELKSIDTLINNVYVNYGQDAPNDGNRVLLNASNTGASISERIGVKLTMKSVYIKGLLRYTPYKENISGTDYFWMNDNVRLLLVYDRQSNGVVPSITEILRNGGSNYTPYSPMNLAYRDRFQVVYDKVINIQFTALSNAATTQQNYMIKKFQIYKKLNHLVTYDSTVANTTPPTIAQIRTGALYLFFLNDLPQSGSTTIVYDTIARVRFIDP